jgi:hypothetical protein
MASSPSQQQACLPPKSALLLKSIEFQEDLVTVGAIPDSLPHVVCRATRWRKRPGTTGSK